MPMQYYHTPDSKSMRYIKSAEKILLTMKSHKMKLAGTANAACVSSLSNLNFLYFIKLGMATKNSKNMHQIYIRNL